MCLVPWESSILQVCLFTYISQIAIINSLRKQNSRGVTKFSVVGQDRTGWGEALVTIHLVCPAATLLNCNSL